MQVNFRGILSVCLLFSALDHALDAQESRATLEGRVTDAPNTNPGSASFGVVAPVQLNQPRTLQLALKISF